MRYLVGLVVGFAVGAFVALTAQAVQSRVEALGPVEGETAADTDAREVTARLAAMGVEGVS